MNINCLVWVCDGSRKLRLTARLQNGRLVKNLRSLLSLSSHFVINLTVVLCSPSLLVSIDRD